MLHVVVARQLMEMNILQQELYTFQIEFGSITTIGNIQVHIPIPSMYGIYIFTYIWLIFMVNVAKYTNPMYASWDPISSM